MPDNPLFHESSRPCGCDPGADHLCAEHKVLRMKGALEDLLTADETSKLDHAIAIAEHGLGRTGLWQEFSKKYGKTYSIAEINFIKESMHYMLKRIDLQTLDGSDIELFKKLADWSAE